jgi:hypothetical protein
VAKFGRIPGLIIANVRPSEIDTKPVFAEKCVTELQTLSKPSEQQQQKACCNSISDGIQG